MNESGEVWTIGLDFPIRPRARWGFGKPPHAGIEAILSARETNYAPWFARVVDAWEELDDVPFSQDSGSAIYWQNGWLSVLDALSVYAFAGGAAGTYLEIGSGMSTRFAHRAISNRVGSPRIVAIDPSPRDAVFDLCDEAIPRPLEEVDPLLFSRLGRGDVVFFDGSHRCFSNSDVVVFFLEVLPSLNPGVVVGLHDVYLPDDYPPEWSDRFYSEQYILAAYLLGRHDRLEVLLPMHYCALRPSFGSLTEHLWKGVPDDVDRAGSSFWFRIRE